jgi:hypothetical protein
VESLVNIAKLWESVEAIIQDKENPNKAVFAETVESKDVRPSYGLLESQMKPYFDIVRRHGHFMFFDKKGQNISILDPQLADLKGQVEELAKKGKCTILMPFHKEAGSVGKNVSYAKDLLGNYHKQNILGISTGACKISWKEAKKSGGEISKQKTIFEKFQVDWKKIEEAAGIPESLKGSKGMTLLAGFALAASKARNKEIAADQIVAMHDTDITNPKEYAALHHLLVPFSDEKPDAKVLMSTIVQTRLGDAMINDKFSGWLNKEHSPKLTRLACHLMGMCWYLSGERAMRLDVLERMPIATGMGVEILANAYIAGMAATDQKSYIASIAYPNVKIENRSENPNTRVYGEILQPVRHMLSNIGKHIKETDRYIHQWTIDDIKSFNKKYGGKARNNITHADTPNSPNEIVSVQTDFIIPSIKMLEDHGMIKLKE